MANVLTTDDYTIILSDPRNGSKGTIWPGLTEEIDNGATFFQRNQPAPKPNPNEIWVNFSAEAEALHGALTIGATANDFNLIKKFITEPEWKVHVKYGNLVEWIFKHANGFQDDEIKGLFLDKAPSIVLFTLNEKADWRMDFNREFQKRRKEMETINEGVTIEPTVTKPKPGDGQIDRLLILAMLERFGVFERIGGSATKRASLFSEVLNVGEEHLRKSMMGKNQPHKSSKTLKRAVLLFRNHGFEAIATEFETDAATAEAREKRAPKK